MGEYAKEITELENLRKRVRVSYGLYGLVLVIALAMAFIADITWTIALGILALLFYLVVSRKDINTYKNKYQEIKIKRELENFFTNLTVVRKSVFASQTLVDDTLMPAEAHKGIVRIGIRGEDKAGRKVQLADVAFPMNVQTRTGKNKYEIISGCYLRLGETEPSKAESTPVVIFRKNNSFSPSLIIHYKKIGLQEETWRDFSVFSPAGHVMDSSRISPLHLDIPNIVYGNDILFLGDNSIKLLMTAHFLNVGNLSYNQAITTKTFDYLLLPQLPEVMQLAKKYL